MAAAYVRVRVDVPDCSLRESEGGCPWLAYVRVRVDARGCSLEDDVSVTHL